jgi:hypothetical protein
MTSAWIRTIVVAAGLAGGFVAHASAQTYTLTTTLTGAGENPAVNTGAFGSATVTVDMRNRTVTYEVTVYNLPSGVAASHIHIGAIGTNGPVVVNLAPPVPASNEFAFSGTVKDTEFVINAGTQNIGIRSADDTFQAILGNNSYVNVHSAANPAGEIRGQLILQSR